jgi:hypothetical protein
MANDENRDLSKEEAQNMLLLSSWLIDVRD